MAKLTSGVDKAEENIRRLESQAVVSSASSGGEASLPRTPASLVGATALTSGAASSSSALAALPSQLKATEDKMKVFEGIVTVLDRELEKYSEEVDCI